MASTLEKIKKLLLSKEESKETKLYAEMILDDGRVLATEDEEFIVGSIVLVVGDDGETAKLDAGTYTLQDGSKITIDDESKILTIGEEEEEIEAEEEEEEKEEMKHTPDHKEDKMEEIDEEELSKAIFEHTPDHIDEDKAKEMAKKIKEMAYGDDDKEEMSEEVAEEVVEEENKEEEMVEMSKDMISSLVEEVEDLKAQIIELEKEPGAEGFTHNPEVTKNVNKKSLISLSHHERVRELINNYK
jgi:murein L,D-transpeptidase YcbB/YkuD|tara:strand:+ start:1029 stop:1760 length:732 start_codon:yes stop_codon:yes gene_type:complete